MSEDSINLLPPPQRAIESLGNDHPTKIRAVPWKSLIGIQQHLARASNCYRKVDPCPVEWHFSFETEASAQETMIPSELRDCLSDCLWRA